MPLKPFHNCFRATSKKTPFFALKWPKNANFGPNQCFLGLGGYLVPLLPYFEGAGLKKKGVACR